MHAIWQADATHEGTPFSAGQAEPHPSQLSGSVLVFTSQPFSGLPSQSANGAVHSSTTHAPPLHVALACAKVQEFSQAPQCAASVFRLVSQPLSAFPSQSPLPPRQLSEQVPFVQSPPAQSVGSLHVRPGKQAGHSPPQSVSPSLPFRTRSLHVGCAQPPSRHTPLAQSRAATQCRPGSHGVQAPPPQSASVSVPD